MLGNWEQKQKMGEDFNRQETTVKSTTHSQQIEPSLNQKIQGNVGRNFKVLSFTWEN